MAFQKPKDAPPHEPAGFTPHSSGLASERAREQGWQTNEDERRRLPEGKRDVDGGTDYDYGARNFGDQAVDTSSSEPQADTKKVESIKTEQQETAKRKKKAA
jgi:hypothetical protein